ncbi:MAG: clostripain-related cysteine peptidase [Spirochaetales bacterium]|nr:clostripain-related cysteine peptidase [Spirochaetales bacterium]
MKKSILIFVSLSLLFISCPVPDGDVDSYIESYVDSTDSDYDYQPRSTDWTVMYYVDADNDLESYLLDDMYELSEGMESTDMMNVIALVDRIDGYSDNSSILGSNFTDTRLFRIGANEIYSLSGGDYFSDIGTDLSGEYNMGDGETLKTFIEYCKENYPADNYALVITNHGGGVKGDSDSSDSEALAGGLGSDGIASKAVSYDYTSDYDCIYTAEMTDVLDDSHSVDLMVYDACLMGLLEIAYQYRPDVDGEFSTDYIAASVPSVWGYGLPYDYIFERISESNSGGTGNYSTVVDGSSYETQYYDPSTMTAEEFGQIIVEEQERDTQQVSSYDSQSFSLYDLSYADDVVSYFDNWASGSGYDTDAMDTARDSCLFYAEGYTYYYPYYDLYDLAEYTSSSDLSTAVDNMVLASFGGADYEDSSINGGDFEEGREGLGFFFTSGSSDWDNQYYYTGEDVEEWSGGDSLYGKLDFCSADGDGDVDGWFELLQSLYNPYDSGTDDYSAYHPGDY